MKDFKVKLHDKDYTTGYKSGYQGERFKKPKCIDGLSYSSGYIEGKADREQGKPPRL